FRECDAASMEKSWQEGDSGALGEHTANILKAGLRRGVRIRNIDDRRKLFETASDLLLDISYFCAVGAKPDSISREASFSRCDHYQRADLHGKCQAAVGRGHRD